MRATVRLLTSLGRNKAGDEVTVSRKEARLLVLLGKAEYTAAPTVDEIDFTAAQPEPVAPTPEVAPEVAPEDTADTASLLGLTPRRQRRQRRVNTPDEAASVDEAE